MLASPLFTASPLTEIATLPFPQAANGEKPYREHHPTRTDILKLTAWSRHRNIARRGAGGWPASLEK